MLKSTLLLSYSRLVRLFASKPTDYCLLVAHAGSIEKSKLCQVHIVLERFIFVEYNVYAIRLHGQLTLLPTRARFSRDYSVLAQQTSNNDRPKIVGVIERRLLYDGRVKKYKKRYNVDKKKHQILLTQLLRNCHLI